MGLDNLCIENFEVEITDTYNVFQGKIKKNYHIKIFDKFTDDYVYCDDEVGGEFLDKVVLILKVALTKLAENNIPLISEE